MKTCLFATDLHGSTDRYDMLFEEITRTGAGAVFIGGDLLPHRDASGGFLTDYVGGRLTVLRERMGQRYPSIFVIMGNDDARAEEASVVEIEKHGLWQYAHNRRFELGDYTVYGYACVPPTPFVRKDFDRYDVSPDVRPGCVAPEERGVTIADDLEALAGADDLQSAVFLFHTPPFETALDRVAVYDTGVESVGSVAVRDFIEKRQPLLTLHGHIHESTRLTGEWHEQLGRTLMFNGAHDGSELSIVGFDLDAPEDAVRILL